MADPVAPDSEPPRSSSVEADLVRRVAATFVDITHDSRQVGAGWLFACVPGERHDGHDFAAAAIEQGATGLLVERQLDLAGVVTPTGECAADVVEQIVVDDVRAAIGPFAAALHDHPARQLRIVGVTGTNGKTTTTHILTDLLNALGQRTTQIGTLSGERTTPEAADLQRLLATFVTDGFDAVVMEVSSHALALHRVDGMRFALAVFTNLGHDHLDLHGSVESYFAAKASLFSPQRCERGLVNVDDEWGRALAADADVPIEGYSVGELDDVEVGVDRLSFVWRGHRATLRFGGTFNVENAVAALEAARLLGHDASDVAAALAAGTPVSGRFEPVSANGVDGEPVVIVDYAHTPDGLQRLLASARELRPSARIVVVFGCGGDRDHEKRPLMGRVAAEGADVVVLTSDNPRTEDPLTIIDEVRVGVSVAIAQSNEDPGPHVIVEPDRALAIQASIAQAAPGDIVLIAGKGHEVHQAVGDRLIPFDDRLVATAALESAR